MEKLLLKLATQLDAIDEASLMALWSKYATRTAHFEPTKRWEESCLIFSLIQAKRWKNQLFNYNWTHQRLPPTKGTEEEPEINTDFTLEHEEPVKECRILDFRSGKKINDES